MFLDSRPDIVDVVFSRKGHSCAPNEKMARPEGLEPPTYGFEARRSIQLSYGRATVKPNRKLVQDCQLVERFEPNCDSVENH